MMPHTVSFRPLFAGVFLLALFASVSLFAGSPLVVYNGTDSLPHGFYRIVPKAEYRQGELVALPVPACVRELVHGRGWLPEGAFLIKPIAGIEGDLFCARRGRFVVAGVDFGAIRSLDPHGLAIPLHAGCRRLRRGELVLAGPDAGSFDSRYFGPVGEEVLIGVAQPLWTWAGRQGSGVGQGAGSQAGTRP